jgi:hypothetical protein
MMNTNFGTSEKENEEDEPQIMLNLKWMEAHILEKREKNVSAFGINSPFC